MKTAIVIPARYGSSRFPGKPLAKIAGKTMLERVLNVAQNVKTTIPDLDVIIATEDQRIADHANEIGGTCILTPDTCATGSDRVLAAISVHNNKPDFVINLQGDAPFTPPEMIVKMIKAYESTPEAHVITPVHRLSWDDLDTLRERKKETPFSGTTAIINAQGQALWFSKNILPALRKEDALRSVSEFSPVHQHIGLYGYKTSILEKFCALTQGTYEELEGLEQLRMLENDIKIQTVNITFKNGAIQSGIDSPEDIDRAENHIQKYGDPHQIGDAS